MRQGRAGRAVIPGDPGSIRTLFKTILAPVDGSDHAAKAADLAVELAKAYGAKLILLHVTLQGEAPMQLRRLAELLGEIVLGFAFLAFAGVMILARLQVARQTKDYGSTTVVAAMLTFVLGALAARGEIQVAVAAAVLTAMLLGVKPILHGWIARVSFDELLAVLKLLVMTAVLLPVLPDRGFGPWQALNPQETWLMVILIAGISFLGYVGVRLIGESRGLLLTALAGGLEQPAFIRTRISCSNSMK